MKKSGLICGLSFLIFSLGFPSVWADKKVTGVLRERGTRIPLSAIKVFLLPLKLSTTSDAKGRFEFALPEGDSSALNSNFELVVNATGYLKHTQSLTQAELVGESNSRPINIFLEKQTYSEVASFETTVVTKQNRRDTSVRSLQKKEFLQAPGSGGDPIKAVQNLPGINRPRGGGSSVVIQGTGSAYTKYQVNGHEVPIIFHFGGLSSVVLPEALERVDYFSAGYGPVHGRAIGGLIGVETLKPSQERLKGFGFVDTTNAGAMIEGPINKKSRFAFGIRQSYVGLILREVLKGDKNFNLTVAPAYRDAIGIYENQVTPIDDFKFVMLGSMDELEFLFSKPVDADPSIRGGFSNQTSFFRLIPEWTHRHSKRSLTRFSLGLGRDWLKLDIADNYFYLVSTALTTRGEHERKWNSRFTSQIGFDHRYSWSDVSFKLPSAFSSGGVSNPISSGELKQASVNGTQFSAVGLYWQNEMRKLFGLPLTFGPSLRSEYYSSTGELLFLPRGFIRVGQEGGWSSTLATGWYAQSPEEREVSESYGNPDILAPRSWHLSLKLDGDLRGGSSNGWVISGGPFYRELWNLVENSSETVERDGEEVPEIFNNSGVGNVIGGETWLRLTQGIFSGWLSYTLARSTRQPEGEEVRISRYDQTHNLTLLGAIELPWNFRISTRFRASTGNPNTPIDGGIFDADNDTFLPVRGAIYSERLTPFFQWDIRLDKKWIFDQWILSAYLDVQNVTNQKNQEALQYAYDYSTREEVQGLPILPTIGLKAEF